MASESILNDTRTKAVPGRLEPVRQRGRARDNGGAATLAKVGGIILAGTQSWGACVLEDVVPKALTPIVNRPLICYALRWLRAGGIRSVSVCCNANTRAMRHRLCEHVMGSDGPGDLTVDYYEDIVPRGPAGCIRDAGIHSANDTFVVVDATIVPRIDIVRLLRSHRHSGASLTVVVSSDVAHVGAAGATLRPTGIYVFSKRALEHVPPTGFQDIKETLIPRLYREGALVETHHVCEAVPRINGVDSYLALNDWALSLLLERPDEFAEYRKKGDARIHPRASVDSTTRLVGPIVIGEGSSIGGGATVVGPTTIGARCRIGEGAIICRTSMWNQCLVEPGVVLDRCILTDRTRVRAESAYRYVVFTEHRRRFPRLGRLVDHLMGTDDKREWDGAEKRGCCGPKGPTAGPTAGGGCAGRAGDRLSDRRGAST